MPGFRDRLRFDGSRGEYRDGAVRYMMLRPDALMGILAELPEAMRPQILAAFARSVTRAGGQSARTYQDAGAATPADLARIIEQTAPELGWGIWSLALAPHTLALTVANSPFAAGHGPAAAPVCAPIAGMLGAIGPMILGRPVAVHETACAAVAGGGQCHFHVAALAA